MPDLLFEDVQEARIFPQKAVSFTYKAFGTLLAALQGAPIRHLHFTGGEATLVRDLPRMLGLAREWGVERLSITSNGTLRLSLPGVTLRTPGRSSGCKPCMSPTWIPGKLSRVSWIRSYTPRNRKKKESTQGAKEHEAGDTQEQGESDSMNRPPAEYTPVRPDVMRDFIRTVFEKAGVPAEKAAFLTECLVDNDLRGVFSHGTRQTPHYVSHFQKGELTPDPDVQVVEESPTTAIVDGGGGLGYYPAHRLAHLLIPKAQQMGIAVGITRNHGHIGAAGIYARIPLEHDLFCYVTSGHQLNLQPGHSVLHAAGGSPMAFGLPTGEEPPFVLDFGAMHDLYASSEHVEQMIALAPSTVFRSFGLGCVCQALGGFLCGVPVDPARALRQWSGANQGSFIIVVDPNRFLPIAQFKAEMDEYARKVRQMQPLKGYDRALLAGALEWERAQKFAAEGIPVGPRHAEALRRLAAEFHLTSPV